MAMMINKPEVFESGVDGASPTEWYSKATVDGTRSPWSTAPIGAQYIEKLSATAQKRFRRVKSAHATLGARTDDWAQMLSMVTQTVKVTEFTDGGSTIGTFVLTPTLPIGAWVLQTILVNVTGFAGDTTATLQVGDGTTVARYSTGTPSVFATATAIDMGVPSGVKIHTVANSVTLTITSSTDFTALVTNALGQLTIRIYYLN